jgi:NAD(P)-dependent dehydrogenase (short-subunit alcohol dehydrogenase family)
MQNAEIRVNAVAPGTIKSPMHSPETYAELDALHPVGHMGEISDIVGAILFLESSSFVAAKSYMLMAAKARAPDTGLGHGIKRLGRSNCGTCFRS